MLCYSATIYQVFITTSFAIFGVHHNRLLTHLSFFITLYFSLLFWLSLFSIMSQFRDWVCVANLITNLLFSYSIFDSNLSVESILINVSFLAPCFPLTTFQFKHFGLIFVIFSIGLGNSNTLIRKLQLSYIDLNSWPPLQMLVLLFVWMICQVFHNSFQLGVTYLLIAES
jgi:hypothetical protein